MRHNSLQQCKEFSISIKLHSQTINCSTTSTIRHSCINPTSHIIVDLQVVAAIVISVPYHPRGDCKRRSRPHGIVMLWITSSSNINIHLYIVLSTAGDVFAPHCNDCNDHTCISNLVWYSIGGIAIHVVELHEELILAITKLALVDPSHLQMTYIKIWKESLGDCRWWVRPMSIVHHSHTIGVHFPSLPWITQTWPSQ